jgi:histidinol-phosphate aminotransferase
MSGLAKPRPGLSEEEPYTSRQVDVPVRLNTNESPIPLPERFFQMLATVVREIPLHRYPDSEMPRLREKLAEYVGRPAEMIWAANGSNEILQELFLAYGGPKRSVAIFEPTYVVHERIAWLTHTAVAGFTMEPPFRLGPKDVAAAAAAKVGLVLVCSPNNPTGNAQDFDVIRRFAEQTDALVVVDEAYVEFGGETALPLLDDHPNLVIVRTLSKAFALAGARLGYCVAAPPVVDDLRRVRLPYHVSALTQAAGIAALLHADEARAAVEAIRAERDRLLAGLRDVPGVEAFASDANFVLFKPPRPAEVVWKDLLDRGVLVRDMTAVVPGALRVSAGTTAEVDAFFEALREVLT